MGHDVDAPHATLLGERDGQRCTGQLRIQLLEHRLQQPSLGIERAVRTDILGHQLPVACAEDIIVLKVLADRLQDRADVAAIIASQGAGLRWDVIEDECRALELEPPARPTV